MQSFLIKNKGNGTFYSIESSKGFYEVQLLCVQNRYELIGGYPKQYVNTWCDFKNGLISRDELKAILNL